MKSVQTLIYHHNLADNAVYYKFEPKVWLDYRVSTHINPLFIDEFKQAMTTWK